MEAVSERKPPDPQSAYIDALIRCMRSEIGGGVVGRWAKLLFSGQVNTQCFLILRAVGQLRRGLFQHVENGCAGPRSDAEIGGVEIAQRLEAIEGRIDPVIQGDV